MSSEPTEEELRAAYEAELERITVSDVVAQTAVSLINLAARRLGMAEGGGQVDPDQARDAIDAVRALLPVLERQPGAQLAPLRDALSQLQMVYAREHAGGAAGEKPAAAPPPQGPAGSGQPDAEPGGEDKAGPGPAQASGRLWIPGQ